MENNKQSVVSSNLGAALESIRFEKGLNQIEFAELGGISQGHYSDIKKNKKIPNINTLEKFCNNIGVPLVVVILKAMFEDQNCSAEKRRLVREIKPLIDKVTEILYPDKKETEEAKKTQ